MADQFFPEGMPLPASDTGSGDAGFWEACRRHELVVQRCTDCGTFRPTPEVICYECLSFNFEWHRVSGKGRIFSHMNVVYPAHPALRERVPYNAVLVELEDVKGIRMVGNLVDCSYEDIHIGMPVEIYFEDHPDKDVTLPLWKRVGQ